MSRALQKTCLRPHYSLRRQLFVSFGTTSAVAIAVVIIASIITTKKGGETVKDEARDLMRAQVFASVQSSSEYVADTLSRKLDNLGRVSELLAEVARDRIVGYPDDFQDDKYVPFLDSISGSNIYPINEDLLPADWNINTNVNSENYYEHVQERFEWYENQNRPFSTATAAYRMQGACDPSETNPMAPTYYENCTDANNDVKTGGAVQPTDTNWGLAEKSADLAVFLKPIYEIQVDIKGTGIYFANSGAGASAVFPPSQIDGTKSYTSIGCAWMNETNPYTGLPLGSAEEIARCHPEGARVPAREYNPLERGWCKDQALNPDRVQDVGPYRDAFTPELWLLTVGRAVFDRKTGHFLACTLLDVSIEQISDIIEESNAGPSDDISLVRWEDGTVVSSSQWQSANSSETMHVTDIDYVTEAGFNQIKSLVDFNSEWDPEQVRKAFSAFVIESEGGFFSALPIPVPPEEYDQNYSPDFVVILSTSYDVFDIIDKTNQSIDEDVFEVIITSVAFGIFGFILVLLVTWTVSRSLTRPLEWISRESKRILHQEGRLESNEEEEPFFRCTPKTEITSLVAQFRAMIQDFSGVGGASVATAEMLEIRNQLLHNQELTVLYRKSAEQPNEKVVVDTAKAPDLAEQKPTLTSAQNEGECTDIICDHESDGMASSLSSEPQESDTKIAAEPDVVDRSNVRRIGMDGVPAWGSHHVLGTPSDVNAEEKFESRKKQSLHPLNEVRRSRLFWWIVVLIVAPLIITMAAICTLVTFRVRDIIPHLLEEVEVASEDIERTSIDTAARGRALFAEEVLADPIRDLHVLSRFVEWLMFDGIKQAESLTEFDTATEECKAYPDRTCPFFFDEERTPCDCRWEDAHGQTCQAYQTDSRYLQRPFYAGQSLDTDSVGTRSNITTYAASPETTAWWDSLSSMPGASKGLSASGHNTTYDRVRVLSAAAAVKFPIYNHRAGTHFQHEHGEGPSHQQPFIGAYVGFEADGMLVGYDGCEYVHASLAHFQSTEENGAARIRPDLCKLGKFGYDCRCRGWYATGKAMGEVHITPPYVFAGSELLVASSATSPLVDPSTDEHVGQVLVDFIPSDLFRTLASSRIGGSSESFAIVITPQVDALGGDTVVGPGFSTGTTSPAIEDVVLPYDDPSSTNREEFMSDIVSGMKAGNTDNGTFRRSTEDGDEQTWYISYAPVEMRTLTAVLPSDFSRGATASTQLVYSLGIAVLEEKLNDLFDAVDDDVSDDLNQSLIILTSIIIAVAVVVIVLSSLITISITRPVVILLKIVEDINAKRIKDEFPPMSGGSREVQGIYISFSKFYKVLRASNAAFFSGNMPRAYKFLNDALGLFRRAQDSKAIGIATNNLGNTVLAMYREKVSTDRCRKIHSDCIQPLAERFYNEAVEVATAAYADAINYGDHESTMLFAEQLANRSFNRGIFLLLTSGDTCASTDAPQRGEQDLLKAKDLDGEVRDYLIATRQLQKNSARYFDRLLRRASGLLELLRGGRQLELWPVAEVIEEAESLLFVSRRLHDSPMFSQVSPLGRLQQLEAIAIESERYQGNVRQAAYLGMRMLVDDEFVETASFFSAASALNSFLKLGTPACNSGLTVTLHEMGRRCKTAAYFDLGKKVVFGIDQSCGEQTSRVLQCFSGLYKACCFDSDLSAFVTASDGGVAKRLCRISTVDQDSFPLTAKNPDLTKVSATNVMERAIELLEDSADCLEYDSWVIVATSNQGVGSFETFPRRIAALNENTSATVYTIIIGINLNPDEEAAYKRLCRVAKESLYIDARNGLDEIDDELAEVKSLMVGGGKMLCSIPGGITMEQF